MKMSIIIPTLNEENNIGTLLNRLLETLQNPALEVIVVDAGSTDATREVALSFPVTFVECDQRSRAIQMNLAAEKASGDVLYFVHADCVPPSSFYEDIRQVIEEGEKLGGYRFKFKTNKKILSINSWFTRFNILTCRGGDQTLFITREAFSRLKGYNSEYSIMEEYDLILRAKELGVDFKLIPKDVMVSDRKYENNSYLQVNLANLKAMRMFRNGSSPDEIKEKYFAMLNHPKDIK